MQTPDRAPRPPTGVSAAARLGAYGAALVLTFGGSYAVAGAVIPDDVASGWSEPADHSGDVASHATTSGGDHADAEGDHADAEGDHADPQMAGDGAVGVSLEQDGYQMAALSTPSEVDRPGEIVVTLTDPDGRPVTDYDTSHERDLHLIVVSADGSQFDHVHPEQVEPGVWSLPWTWTSGGAYRVYADFVPTGLGEQVTVSRTVQVAGPVGPATPPPVADAVTTGDLDVALEGTVSPGRDSELTFTVTREGGAVDLQPYLGADGHLVALRQGDQAFLHVHPVEEASLGPGQVRFAVEAPSTGTYQLYLDLQVDGEVRTAALTVRTD